MLAPLRGHHSAANSRMDLHEAVAATAAAAAAAAAAATVGAFGRPVPTARVSVLPGPPPSMELRGCRYWDSSVPCRAGQAADRMIASVNPPALQRSGRLTIPNYQSKRCLCLSQGVEGRSSSLLLLLLLRLLFVLVVLVSAFAPGIDARRQQRGGQSDVAATVPTASVNCQPVPYDSLWQRLDLYHHPHRHHSHSRDRRQPSRRTRSGESPIGGDTLRWKRSVAGLTPPPPPTTTERPGPRNATEAGGVRSKPDHRIRQHRRKRKRLPGGDRTARTEEGHREEEEEGDTPDHQRELWQCDMTTKWKKMARGTFPPYVQTGKCRQTKCMLGVYECKARRYLVKVMKRVDAACLPVPSIGVNSTYEEAWVFSDVKVTVGCDCVLRNPGHYVITKTGS